MTTMRLGRKGLDLIKSYEGFVPYVYDDLVPSKGGRYAEWSGEAVRGTLTIGFGHTDAAGPPKIRPGLRVTEKEATEILDRDLDACEAQVNKALTKPVTQGQFDALVSFFFNCGPGNGRNITARINRGDYTGARAAFALYTKSKGKSLLGLVRRRTAEQALWDDRYMAPPTGPVDHPAEVDPEPDPPPPAPKPEPVKPPPAAAPIGVGILAGLGALMAGVDWTAVIITAAVLGLAGFIGFKLWKGK